MELDLTEAITVAAQAIRDANAPEAWTSTHLVPAHVYAEAAIRAVAPLIEHAVREKVAQELLAVADDERAVWDLIRSPFPGRVRTGHDHRLTRDGLQYAAAIARENVSAATAISTGHEDADPGMPAKENP